MAELGGGVIEAYGGWKYGEIPKGDLLLLVAWHLIHGEHNNER